MKAVIVDLRAGQAAALCDDGRVIKLADPGYSLGQIVEVHERKRRTPRWAHWVSTAAAAALLLAGAGGGAAWAMPYGVVSLDVNPSLEYTINRFDYVLKVEGVNEDGKELLSRMDTKQLVHRPIGDALDASVQQLEDGQWLGGESSEILISAGAKQPSHAEKLVQTLQDDLGSRRESLEIYGVTVSEAEIDEAHREGMSAGRHRVLDELRESEGADFAFNEWADRPIRDIFHRLETGPEGTSGQPDAYSVQPGPRQDMREDTRPAMGGTDTDTQPEQEQPHARQQAEPSSENPPAEQPREQRNEQPQAQQHNEQPQAVPGENRHDGGTEPSRPDSGGFGGMPGDGQRGAGGSPGGGTGGPGGPRG